MANQSLITRLFEQYKGMDHNSGEEFRCPKCDLKDALQSVIGADTKTHHPYVEPDTE